MRRFYIFTILIFSMTISFLHAQKQLEWEPLITDTYALAFALNPLDENIIYTTKDGFFRVSHDGGTTWDKRGSVPGQEIRNITICPVDTAIILMYANGSLLRSTNSGIQFNEVLSGVSMDGETIEFHPTDPDSVFYVDFGGGNLWVSGDRGATWNIRSNVSLTFVCSFSVNPNNPKMMIAGAGNTRINRSVDGGFTWETVKDGNAYFSEVPKIKWDPTHESRVFGSTYLDETFSVFRSEDGAASWSTPGIFGIPMWGLDISPTGDVYIGSFAGNEQSEVFKSYDSGNSWQLLGDLPGTAVWMIKSASDSVVTALSLQGVFGIGGIYKLKIPDLGYLSGVITDSISGQKVEFASISVKQTGDVVHVGNKNGSYKMALLPGTYSITFSASGIEKTIQNIEIVAGTESNLAIKIPLDIRELTFSGVVKDVNGFPVPSQISVEYQRPTTEQITELTFSDQNGYFEFDSLTSINEYTNLTIKPLVLPYFLFNTDSFNVSPGQEYFLDFADMFLADGGDDPNIREKYELTLEKLGLTWVYADASLDNRNISTEIIKKTKMATLIWFGRHDSTTISPSTLDSLDKIVKAGHNIIMSGQDMLENNDESKFFQDIHIGFEGNYAISGFADLLTGIDDNSIGKDLSLIIRNSNQPSTDILSFSKENASAAFYYGSTLTDTNMVAGVTVNNTGSGGKAVVLGFDLDLQNSTNISEIIHRSLDWFSGISGVEETPVIIPQRTELFQNYPNPFNPVTKVSYRLIGKAKVSLKVFDMLGREIKTLVNSEQSSGGYSVSFDATNLSSGVYFYTLKVFSLTKSGDVFEQTRKMLLVR